MQAFYLVTVLPFICCYGVVLATTDSQANAEESVFLASHNLARSQFGAQPLGWSTILASKAQMWASGCHFRHTDGQLGPYGENIAAGTGNFTAGNAMNMFMSGLLTFDPDNPTYSDFTQIVWGSTAKLGCASALCSGVFDAAFGEATMYICLYEPVGNVVGALRDNVGPGL